MSRTTRLIPTAIFALILAPPPVLPAAESAVKPNIVILVADQWRATATGYAGDPNVKTPALDRFAKEGIWFQNAVSVCPVCTPFRAVP